jgi:hypothetical protein
VSEWTPIKSLSDLDAQNDDDIYAGYRAGRAGMPEPGSDKSRAYWHGWRNGMADSGRMPIDESMRALAHAYVSLSRAH